MVERGRRRSLVAWGMGDERARSGPPPEGAWGKVPRRTGLLGPREQIETSKVIVPAAPGLGIMLNEATLRAHRKGGR